MVLVDGESGDLGAREPRDFARRPAHAAADVQNVVVFLDAGDVREVMFVAGDGGSEGLARTEAAKVEGLGPAVFVEVGGEVVVLASDGGIVCFAGLGGTK